MTNIDIIVLVGSAIVMMVVLDQFVRRSRLGRGIRAVAQDPETAALMGVNLDRVIQADVPHRRPHGRRRRRCCTC